MKVHLRLDGQSRTLEGRDLDVAPHDSPQHIIDRLAHTLALPQNKLKGLIIDHHPDGVVVRPPAIFG